MGQKTTIQVNGQSHSFSTPVPLKQILERFRIDSRFIAVAVNGEVVPRSLMERQIIRGGDSVEMIRAVAGG